MSDEVKIVQDALDGLKSQLDTALAAHTAEIENNGKATTDLTGKIDDLSAKYAETEKALGEIVQKQDKMSARKVDGPMSLGESFMKSEKVAAFMESRGSDSSKVRVEIKNTIIGEGGSPQNPVDTIVPTDRLAGIVPGAFRSLNILDVIPMGSTGSNQIEYTQEATFTNAAAEAAEAAAKAETDLTFTLVNEPVRTIAHWIKVSKQVLDDAPMIESYINGRLVYGVRKRLQTQVLAGNGTTPNLSGLSASGRHTAFTPTSGESGLDSINRAKYAVIGADFEANVVLVNPANWGVIERAKRGSSDKGYVLGDGAAVNYIANGMVPTVWGLPVIMSNDVTSGKFFVLDRNATQLFMRSGVEVEMGFVNADFTNNLMTIRAEMRAAMAVYQPTAVRYGSLTL